MSFIDELSNDVWRELAKLDEIPITEISGDPRESVIALLKIALKNEIEASEIAAYWMHSTPEIDAKLGLARQCGDEAKHYRIIENRLSELGVSTDSLSPLAAGYSPMFQWLKSLETTVERVAAGPFAREAIAVKRNAQFIAFLEAAGDKVSAAVYRDHIQEDEEWHHNFGLAILRKYAVTPELQERARQAAIQTLALAEELRETAIKKMGSCVIPGC